MSASSGFSAAWLGLREAADAQARCTALADAVADQLRRVPRLLVHDLGCGTGSMRRWLAPRLPEPQHWVLHDRDPELLALAAAGADEVEARLGDVSALTARDLAGADLVTTSALLDLLTAREVDGLAVACIGAGCAALFTLSVAGRVELTPADPLDGEIATAFDLHQRRTVHGRRLLGPDAVAVASDSFTRLGARVQVCPSPWRLGPDQAALTAEWLRGWVGAAVEQRPDLPVGDYLRRRSAEAADGRLRVVVHHLDLLARPR
jgi:SAM-dependent methyltransferase